MRNLTELGTQISVPISADGDGFLGRECPVDECLRYFKVTPGTGVKGPVPCICPYCGHRGESRTFFTKEQIEYAKSVVMRKVADAIRADLKTLEFEHKPRGPFGIGISMKLQPSAPRPVRYYKEKALETEVVCDNCSLRYAIYGVFGWCPDCGVHNSLQILVKNLELGRKQLLLTQSTEPELNDYLVGDALKNLVSAFDGFGRQICSQKGAQIQFQSLKSARRRVKESFGIDFADSVGPEEWEHACCMFQKRHLLVHKMGVIDAEYIQKAGDSSAVIGRKVRVTFDEVTCGMSIIERLGRSLFQALLDPKTPDGLLR